MTSPTPAYSPEALQLKSVIEELIATGRLPEAIDLAHQGLARGLVHARFYGLVAFRLEELGRNEEATEQLGNGLALEPDNIELITSLGYCFLNLERVEESVFVFRRALAQNPDWEPAQYGLGVALRADGDLVGAATLFGQVLSTNPTHLHTLTALAGLAEMRGAWDDARHFTDRALTLEPENAAGLLVSARLGFPVQEIRHERLVADFDAEVGPVCDFLGISLTESMRDFSQTARTRVVRSRSSNQVTEGLNTKGLGQWRRYDWALEPVMPILKPWVRQFGYEI